MVKRETKAFREGFRTKLIAAREASGLTPGNLAAKVGTSAAQLSRWESGLYVPKFFWIVCLAEALGVELSALVPETKKPSRRTKASGRQDGDRMD